jgi:hypothetical protein
VLYEPYKPVPQIRSTTRMQYMANKDQERVDVNCVSWVFALLPLPGVLAPFRTFSEAS